VKGKVEEEGKLHCISRNQLELDPAAYVALFCTQGTTSLPKCDHAVRILTGSR
jgi:hypothetical protein